MNLNKKDLISIAISVLAVVASIVLFFFPDVIGYEKSYVAIEEKRETIEINNQTIEQNEAQIASLDSSITPLKEQAQMVKLNADREQAILSDVPKTLDIPSFLISMEKEAQAKKISLKVNYAGIQKNSMAPTPETNAPETGAVQNSATPTPNATAPSAESPAVESFNRDNALQAASSGLQTAIVPIEVSGGYKNIREYISYLDGIGLVRPYSVSMSSEGKLVNAKINLNIMYGEVMR